MEQKKYYIVFNDNNHVLANYIIVNRTDYAEHDDMRMAGVVSAKRNHTKSSIEKDDLLFVLSCSVDFTPTVEEVSSFFKLIEVATILSDDSLPSSLFKSADEQVQILADDIMNEPDGEDEEDEHDEEDGYVFSVLKFYSNEAARAALGEYEDMVEDQLVNFDAHICGVLNVLQDYDRWGLQQNSVLLLFHGDEYLVNSSRDYIEDETGFEDIEEVLPFSEEIMDVCERLEDDQADDFLFKQGRFDDDQESNDYQGRVVGEQTLDLTLNLILTEFPDRVEVDVEHELVFLRFKEKVSYKIVHAGIVQFCVVHYQDDSTEEYPYTIVMDIDASRNVLHQQAPSFINHFDFFLNQGEQVEGLISSIKEGVDMVLSGEIDRKEFIDRFLDDYINVSEGFEVKIYEIFNEAKTKVNGDDYVQLVVDIVEKIVKEIRSSYFHNR